MMDHRLHRLAVFRYAFRERFAVSEIIADAIPRKDFRRHQPRASIAAVVTQNEFVKPRFPHRPIFLGRDEDRLPLGPLRSTKDKGVNALAIDYLYVGQLAGLLFNDDGRERATDKSERQSEN